MKVRTALLRSLELILSVVWWAWCWCFLDFFGPSWVNRWFEYFIIFLILFFICCFTFLKSLEPYGTCYKKVIFFQRQVTNFIANLICGRILTLANECIWWPRTWLILRFPKVLFAKTTRMDSIHTLTVKLVIFQTVK